MDKFEQVFEQFKVAGKDLVEKIKELIHEGNVRRIIVKDENGHTFMEIPLTVATIGVVAAPILAAVGAAATVIARFHIVVERAVRPHDKAAGGSSPVTDSSVGATEGTVDMRGTVPERINKQGTKVEDLAGTGEHDSRGG
jgi:bifunctional ADP-heptose synthase (sugar kinase/adenylyltransferase)